MAALKVAKKRGIPLVYEIRAFWEDAAVGNGTGRENSLKYRLTRSLESHVVAGADAVVTICSGLRDDLIARGTAPSRITIMPNGVDMEMFGTPVPPDNALAAELGLLGADGPNSSGRPCRCLGAAPSSGGKLCTGSFWAAGRRVFCRAA